MKTMARGQTTIAVIASVASMVAAVATPIIYIGNIKEVNVAQGKDIENVKEQHVEFKQEYQEMRNELKTTNAKIDALLIANGIQPDSVSRLTTK